MDIAVADTTPYADEHRLAAQHRTDLTGHFEALPGDRYPNTRTYASELTSGTAHERFDFTLGLLLRDFAS